MHSWLTTNCCCWSLSYIWPLSLLAGTLEQQLPSSTQLTCFSLSTLPWLPGSQSSKSKLEWLTFGQPACLGVKHPSGAPRPDFYYCQAAEHLFMWGAFSDERTGLSFRTAACPHQLSHSRVWVPQESWPYFTASDLRLPWPGGSHPHLYPPGTGWPCYTLKHWVSLSLPPMTCRAMVEVFKPTSIWEVLWVRSFT
jgi:hypothetical protein